MKARLTFELEFHADRMPANITELIATCNYRLATNVGGGALPAKVQCLSATLILAEQPADA
jgi:hypothetical protein